MRIAIVNDMPMAVEALRRVVTSMPGCEVAWIAADGEQAVRQCALDVPDIVLMDLMMPRMDGAEATRRIMQASPCVILVVTATVEGHTGKVFEAMGCGALDAVDTPVLTMSGDPSGGRPLLNKIAMLGKLIGPTRNHPDVQAPKGPVEASTAALPLLVIGASTGGPAALARILRRLPRDLPAAITVVQHVDEQFAPGLAAWLRIQTGHDVLPIRATDRPTVGRVLVASTNDHLVLTRAGNYSYTHEPADFFYRPSVDVFFQSAAEAWPGPIVGVLLTGMGADGAQGMLRLKQAGWHTIAQDQSTCVVYGMPKAAVKLNAVAEVLPLDEIAPAIIHAIHMAVATKNEKHP